ncbi:amino acid adenylation domain-containing protein [Variovorax sp. RKNM96]|uniref:non-ribosomal peptide synthetase n=1 Tax=Variovorax sp. RKNM96 TaxID=2681552 RepID=UPI001981B8D2|nr:non-ribosomal peptide synthetase [Variovorax sp. RKNM96]QSI32377.1 amino acid adenylation domain-containing protein [Variovorax sp. RKNM96]
MSSIDRTAPTQADTAWDDEDEIRPQVSDGDEVPLSYAQEQLWFLQSLEPGLTAYNLPRTFRLRGAVDADALERAFQAVVERHAILRTRFFEREGIALQAVQAKVDFVLERIDLSRRPEAERKASLEDIVRRTTLHVFDLGSAPALVARLVTLGDDDHVLAVCMHHIVSDAWSNPILAGDLSTAYEQAVRSGGAVHLPPLAVQYADYALWQRERVLGNDLARQLEHWNAHLGPDVPPLELPTDAERPPRQTFNGALHGFALDPELGMALQKFCRAEKCTPFVILLATWQMLLGWYSGQSDFAVGTPNAGRHRDEVRDLLGFFITTQVFRARLAPQLSLRQICRQVRSDAMHALQHADLPFEVLLASRKVHRDAARSPLFQVMFGVQMADGAVEVAFDRTRAELIPAEHVGAKFDLSLDFHIDARSAFAQLEYNTDLFSKATAERLADCYVRLLEMLTADPDRSFASIDLSSAAERAQLSAWGVNETSYPQEEPVHALMERQARLRPEADALVFGDQVLSYGELNARANRLAHRLIGLGVGAESRVGIAVERSIEMVVGILGILKAGGTYVPLDPEYPAERLAYMMADSGLGLVLTQSHVGTRLPVDDAVKRLALDTLLLDGEPAHDPQVAVHGHNLAYLIYTSGSTGRPKGVGIAHQALVQHAQESVRFFGLTSDDRMLQFSTLNFDGFIEQVFPPLVAGAAIVLRGPTLWDSETFYRELIARRISVADLTTAYWHLLAQDFAQDAVRSGSVRDYGALRQVHAGGEAMPPEGLKAWREAGLTHVKLLNTYGPTEATVTASVLDCAPYLREGAVVPLRMPIGEPLAGRALRVVGSDLSLVPQGVAGELCIGGDLLARGYLGRAGLTAERFVADPFDDRGGRLYRTGDLVRWNSEGQLEYLGRIDHQVKVRGFRIELGEIEAQLLAQPEVREAVVVANEGPTGARLVGYVSLQQGQAIETAQLRERLGQALPDYMVPGALVVLQALPLNPNGKVDRKALPQPEYANEQAHEAPEGEVEEALAAVWAQVLGVARVGRNDNFFELGGDSILSLQIVARLRNAGWKVTPRQILERQTIAELALATVRAGEGDRGGVQRAIPSLGTAHRNDGLALSHAQARQWFLWQLAPSSIAYHIAGGFRLSGELAVDVLRSSFQGLVDRHESLRTVFRTRDDGLADQVIHAAWPLEVPLIDLSGLDTGLREAQAEAHAHKVHQTPFDLGIGPLLRVALIRLAPTEHVLVVVMHHIVSDGWSMQLIVDEFVKRYRAGLRGEDAALEPLSVQYADYAAWQRDWLANGERDRQLAYWRQELGTAQPVLRLPTDRPRLPNANYTAAHCSTALPPALVQGLQRLVKANGATLFMSLLAGFNVLLHRHTGQEDIRVGMPVANRHRIGTEGIVGFFVNTLVLPGRIAPRMTLGDVFLQAKEAALGAQLHQDLPFEQLVDALQPERDMSQTPLFQVMVNHQKFQAKADSDLPGLALQDYELGERGAQFELTLDLLEDERGGVHATLTYAKELFEPAAMQRMLAHYLVLLDGLAHSPQQAVGDVALLDAAERAQLSAWGVNETSYPQEEPVHALMERQARLRPEADALVFGDQVLRYGELNARANRLAHRLIGLGVRAESRVGIAVERSIEMVVGILGILKAGGTYVPLDPEYPAERLAYMMADSGLGLVLTQSHVGTRLPVDDAVKRLTLDTLSLDGEPAHDPQVAVHGHNLAYLIYTSGSTGRPKGVGIAHQALGQHAQESVRFFGLTGDDRMLQFSTLNFDGFIEQVFPPLVAGAAIVLRGPTLWDSETFYRELIDRRISVADLTTAYWHLLAQDFAQDAVRNGTRDYGALRQVHAGGEAMPPEGLKAWREAGLAHVKLLNTYGPTEATVTASVLDCAPYLREGAAVPLRMPIGEPLAGRALRVVGSDLSLVPQGVAGELCIGGDLLARGYLGRAALTAERFVADPFDDRGGRLYRTGDLVRWNSEGQLEYLGRIDHQVKVRGFRIELGEIEAQLLAQPEVREAVVVANEGPTGARLVGYVSLQQGQAIEPTQLRERLGQALPDYMVPGALVVLQALPLNPNGKVDRKALPQPEYANEQAHEAPEGEVEEALAAVWAQVLGVARVGRNDNFFELGGDSLMALRLLARMQRTQDPRLKFSLQDLLQKQTIAKLTAGLPADALPQPLLLLNTGAAPAGAAPLFCIAPGLRNALDYQPLARHLEGQRAVYGLSYTDTTRLDSVAQMSAYFVDLIRAVRPTGPVAVLGWSLGSVMAMHTASLLEQEGIEVSFVGLVDSFVMDDEFDPGSWYDDLRQFVAGVATETAGAAQVEAILDRFESIRNESEEVVHGAVSEMMTALGIDMGAIDVVGRVAAARRFNAATAAMPPLPKLAGVSPHLWWSRRRTAEERALLLQDLGTAPKASADIDTNHQGIVRHAALFAGVRSALAATEASVAADIDDGEAQAAARLEMA